MTSAPGTVNTAGAHGLDWTGLPSAAATPISPETAATNELWVTDLTFVPTWAGVACVSFITDAFSRMIVGW